MEISFMLKKEKFFKGRSRSSWVSYRTDWKWNMKIISWFHFPRVPKILIKLHVKLLKMEHEQQNSFSIMFQKLIKCNFLSRSSSHVSSSEKENCGYDDLEYRVWLIIKKYKVNTHQPQSRSYKYRIHSALSLTGNFRLYNDVWVNAEWVQCALRS